MLRYYRSCIDGLLTYGNINYKKGEANASPFLLTGVTILNLVSLNKNMTHHEETTPVEIFAGDFHRAAVIKNLLENNGIYVFMENQHMGSIAPWQVSSAGFNPVRLIISGQNYEEALRLLEDFNNSEALG
jgi:hypothetical protein